MKTSYFKTYITFLFAVDVLDKVTLTQGQALSTYEQLFKCYFTLECPR